MNTVFVFLALAAVAAGADDDTWDNTALDELFHRRQVESEEGDDAWDDTALDELFHRRQADTAENDNGWDNTAMDELFNRRQVQQAPINCRDDPSEQVLGCMSNLEALAHPSSGMVLDEVATPEELDRICEELRASTACVRRVHEECRHRGDMIAELTYKTMAGVVGHMCSDEGKEIILSEQECWSNERLANDIERCGNSPGYGNPCRVLSRARRCVNRAVRRRCNRRAAKFVDELIYYAVKPMSDTLDCDIQLRVSRSLLKSLPLRRK